MPGEMPVACGGRNVQLASTLPTQELAEAVKFGGAQLDGAQPEAAQLATAPGVAGLFLLHQKLAGQTYPHTPCPPHPPAPSTPPAPPAPHPPAPHPPHRTLRTAPSAPSAGGSSRQPDQKLYKAVWAVLRQVPLVHVAGRAQWRPLAFLAQQLPVPSKSMGLQAAEVRACEFVKQLDVDLAREIQAASVQVGWWSVRFASDRSRHPNKRALLEAGAILIIDGVRLANRVGTLVRGCLCGHLELGVPLPKAALMPLVHGIMLLKTLEASFHAQLGWAASTATHAAHAFRIRLRKLLLPFKLRLESARRLDDAALDRLAALTLALQSLEGVPSRQRLLLLQLSLHVSQLKGTLREGELAEVRELQARLGAVCEWQPQLEAACDCSFLFYARPLLPTLLRYAASSPHPRLLPSLMHACRDIAPALRLGDQLGARLASSAAGGWTHAYARHLLGTLERQLIAPLCLSVETDLRLSNHASQALRSDKAEKPQAKVVHELMRLVALPPLAMFAVLLDPRRRVAHHLDTTFYNLSTVALHDWQRYAEMRALAAQRFGLQMVEPHLPAAACVPGQTLEQGLDVLQIMRNIHIFVRLHRYNLNQQLFVEGDSEAKYLSTIGIRHIASSIRTHGLGIMNTTVNFTYQLLKQKLFVCSQFLFDDHIKSRLIKDARFFRQEREAIGNRYPFDRAERFVRDVRKLGVSEAGLTVLDRFRQLITEIGNAMGYVRMVRAGGLHYAATTLGCAPGTVELPDLNALAAEIHGEVAAEAPPAAPASSPLSPHCADAAANLTRVLERIHASFEEGATYFQKLESVFTDEMRSPKNSHLQTFFILVPALTINFVEHLLAAKDKLQRGQLGATFTDDGFAMGLAYLLNLLAQAPSARPA